MFLLSTSNARSGSMWNEREEQMKPLLKEEMAHTIRKVLDEAKGTAQ